MASSSVLVILACLAYRFLPVHAPQFTRRFGAAGFTFTGDQFMVAAATFYCGCLAVYYALEVAPQESKSLRFLRLVAGARHGIEPFLRRPLGAEDRLAVLASLLKMFFAPMMVMSLMMFCSAAVNNGVALAHPLTWASGFKSVFDRYGFWFVMQAIVFVDLLVFTFGYLVEASRLGNTIRSVDSTLLGWAAALMCYPPFNSLTGMLLGSPVSDFPQFDDPTAHLVLNGALLGLMALYAWASVAMGWKASNLTYRGMVESGPYGIVRHPAYACKNIAWWIASVPAISVAFTRSPWDGLTAIGSMAGWSALYVLRALTEEDHLNSLSREYTRYAARVRFRFVPGLI